MEQNGEGLCFKLFKKINMLATNQGHENGCAHISLLTIPL